MDLIIVLAYIIVAILWVRAIQENYAESAIERQVAIVIGVFWLPFTLVLVGVFVLRTVAFPFKKRSRKDAETAK